MNRSIIWALAIVAMVGCQKENDIAGSSDELVSFYSASIATRTTNYYDYDHVTQWEEGDVIAVSAPELGYSNIEYEATSSGTGADFSAVSDKIYKSVNYEGEVTYSAYYPTSAYVNGSYVMNVEDQTEGYMAKDLLYAEKSIEYTTTTISTTVGFTFYHALSLIKFSVDFKDLTGESTYDVEIADVTTEASYTVESGSMVLSQELESGTVSMYTSRENSSAKDFYATVHSLSYGGKMITFTLDGNEYYATYPDDTALEPGYMYTHEVIVGKDGVTIDTATIEDWEDVDEGGSDYVYTTKDTWDGTIAEGFEGANGAAVAYSDDIDTYYIKTGAQLAYLAELVNDNSVAQGKTFIQLNDIDLDDREWTPIGTSSSAFSGTFNGEEHTISGLSITGSDNVGLFGATFTTSTIKDLTVKGSVTGTDYVGGVAGRCYGSIDNCHFSGDVAGDSSVGGIVGYSDGGSMTYCINTATIKGVRNVGGITGYGSTTVINCCYNGGTIEENTIDSSSTKENVGGIIGYNSGGEITACHNSVNVTGTDSVGGVAGYVGNEGSVTSCYNTGTITATDDSAYKGGVIGYMTTATANYIYTIGTIQEIDTTGDGEMDSTEVTSIVDPVVYYSNFYSSLDNYGIFVGSSVYHKDGDSYNEAGYYLIDQLNIGAPGVWVADEDGENNGYPLIDDMAYTFTTEYDEEIE